jgi:uncharacterized protein (DUF4415 family)
MNKPIKTNLERLDAIPDDQIDTSEIPPLTEKFFKTAKWRLPNKQKVKVTVEVEPEILAWFESQGEDYPHYLAAALRIYAQAHQVPAG